MKAREALAVDFDGADWSMVREWAEHERKRAIGTLLVSGLGEGPTEFQRGYVSCLNALLQLEEQGRRVMAEREVQEPI